MMGDAADSAYESAQAESETAYWLRQTCQRTGPERKCEWECNDDALFECKHCGEVTDI